MSNFPKGLVKEVCKEWSVREDGALAQKLQSQEINEFYNSNKIRNSIVREDFPRALNEQRKEVEVAKEVEAKYREYLENQEKADRLLAEKLENNLKIEKLRNEEIDTKKAKNIAAKLLKKEEEAEKQRLLVMQAEVKQAERLAKKLQIYEEQYSFTQAEKDRMIAIKAQNEELAEKDRQLAIETQDEELARLLHEKEKKRAKKLREKHRLKKQQYKDSLEKSQSQQKVNSSESTNECLEIEDTYSDPIDLISSGSNLTGNSGAYKNDEISNRKQIKNVLDLENHIKDCSDEIYALPINSREQEKLSFKEKDVEPAKANFVHKINSYALKSDKSISKEFSYEKTNSTANNYLKGNISNVVSPIPNSFINSESFSNDTNRKKKDKKDKCAHQ